MSDDEQIDKKIQDAAENFRPAFDDDAWKKMEQLLDEHLPQKKDKKRIIFLLILLLISAGAIYFGIHYENAGGTVYSGKAQPVIQADELASGESLKTRPGTKTALPLKGNIPADSARNTSSGSTHKLSTVLVQNNIYVKKRFGTTGSKFSTKPSAENNADVITKNIIAIAKTDISIIKTEKSSVNNVSKEVAISTVTNDATRASNHSDIDSGSESVAKNNLITKKEAGIKIKDVKIKRQANHFVHNFSIGFVTGPDVSGVKLDNIGKLTFIIGGQVAYRIAHKFTLRSGFLVEKKIYSVGANEYHPQLYNPANDYLQTVGANCTIYEVPLTLSYNFSKAKKHEWFVSAGLSSYFMKKESYEYFYKIPSGNTYTNYYSVSNKNKHYFSVIDLSAGYSHTINRNISFAVEPYLKMPVTGIGVGKIKLNSAGVLFSLNFRKF